MLKHTTAYIIYVGNIFQLVFFVVVFSESRANCVQTHVVVSQPTVPTKSMCQFKSASMNMIEKFNDMTSKILQHLQAKPEGIQILKLSLHKYLACETIDINNCHRCLTSDDINNQNDIYTLMAYISGFSSFFNFKVVEDAIRSINHGELNLMLDEYKKKFKEYLDLRVTECPSELSSGDQCHKCFKVQLDDTFKNCRQEYLLKLQHDICEILNIEPKCLEIEGIEQGSIWIIFFF